MKISGWERGPNNAAGGEGWAQRCPVSCLVEITSINREHGERHWIYRRYKTLAGNRISLVPLFTALVSNRALFSGFAKTSFCNYDSISTVPPILQHKSLGRRRMSTPCHQLPRRKREHGHTNVRMQTAHLGCSDTEPQLPTQQGYFHIA